jgi:hypothetical protein
LAVCLITIRIDLLAGDAFMPMLKLLMLLMYAWRVCVAACMIDTIS